MLIAPLKEALHAALSLDLRVCLASPLRAPLLQVAQGDFVDVEQPFAIREIKQALLEPENQPIDGLLFIPFVPFGLKELLNRIGDGHTNSLFRLGLALGDGLETRL